jgi:restriction endonuclease Mrr
MVTVHRAHRGLFVTTSGFTKPASDLAAAHGVEMWDADVLSKLLIQMHAPPAGPQPNGAPDGWWWDGAQWRQRQ